MIKRFPSDDRIAHVIRNLREADAEEQLAAGFCETREELAKQILAQQSHAIASFALCADDGEAVAIIGAYLVAPSVAAVHQAATDRWPEIGREAFRFYRRIFIPGVLRRSVRLAECRILASHELARRWIGRLGFTENGRPLPYGNRGELFAHCVWINPSPAGVRQTRCA